MNIGTYYQETPSYQLVFGDWFVRGDPLSLSAAEFVYKNTFAQDVNKSYLGRVEEIKQFLGGCELVFYKDLLIVEHEEDLDEETTMVMVRYLNMCHGKKVLIIMYNGEVVFMPYDYMAYGTEHAELHAKLRYKKWKAHKVINKFKAIFTGRSKYEQM